MRSNWRRHRGQAYILHPADGLGQGGAHAPRSNTESMQLRAFDIAPQFPVPHGMACYGFACLRPAAQPWLILLSSPLQQDFIYTQVCLGANSLHALEEI